MQGFHERDHGPEEGIVEEFGFVVFCVGFLFLFLLFESGLELFLSFFTFFVEFSRDFDVEFFVVDVDSEVIVLIFLGLVFHLHLIEDADEALGGEAVGVSCGAAFS